MIEGVAVLLPVILTMLQTLKYIFKELPEKRVY
jgi:hypothetical protein